MTNLVLQRKEGEGVTLIYQGRVLGHVALAQVRGRFKARIAFQFGPEVSIVRDELLSPQPKE